MVVERALDELHIRGTFDESRAGDHPTVTSLMRDVLDHGEVHARWADAADKVEVRQGTATFDFDAEVIVVDDGITDHSFAMDQLVSWDKPMNVFHTDDE